MTTLGRPGFKSPGWLLIAALGLASSASLAAADYQAWSGLRGPDSAVQFEFGMPRLIVSLKTDGTAIYAPHAFRASDGTIFLGYYTYPDGWSPDPFPAALIRSLDNGLTWRSLGERGNLGYMLGETADKSVMAVDCSWAEDANGDRIYATQKFSPSGAPKPEIIKVRVHGFAKAHEPYFHLTRMVRARNGSLVTAAYTATEGTTHAMWWDEKAPSVAVRIVCLTSEDEGRNWRFLSYVEPGEKPPTIPPPRSRVCEPFVEALADGRLLCIYRTQGPHGLGEMMQSWSSDSGVTWTDPVSSGIVGVDPCLLQLRNGVLLCAFGRPDVRLMYSLDGGGHWRGLTTLYHYVHSDPQVKTGDSADERRPISHAYTSIVALSDDRILYFFDIHEHRIPWSGLLPSEPARRENRTNSIFEVPIQVTVTDHEKTNRSN